MNLKFECFTSGVITLKVKEGDRVEPGDVLCLIEKQKKIIPARIDRVRLALKR